MRKSRLSEAKQAKLIEHFVAGTTARCAADLVGVNRNTAAYYFQRLRDIIADQTEQAAHEILKVKLKSMKATLVAHAKASADEVQQAKSPYLGCSSAVARCTPRLLSMPAVQLYCRLLSAKSFPTALCIRIAGRAIMHSILQVLSITESTTQSCLRMVRIISMVLRTFGIKPSDLCVSLTVYRRRILGCF